MPSDSEVLIALRDAHHQSPDLGRNELFAQVKPAKEWPHLSNKHLKRLITAYPLDSDALPPATLPPPRLPDDALAAQQYYKDTWNRTFRIYGRGAHDYSVSPNSEQQILIGMIHTRLLKAGAPGPFSATAAASIGKAWPLQHLLALYCAAAQKTEGEVTREDCGRQLAAEYGVDPLPYFVEKTELEKEERKRKFKQESMKLKREMLKTEMGRRYIPTDASGEPVWDEAVNGEFVVLVEKIPKEGY